MSKLIINQYYNEIDQYKRYGGTRNESSVRRAFANLLEKYCRTKNLVLVDEIALKTSQKRPDGTVKDALSLDWGHWESKDAKDNLDDEIDKKLAIGYPQFNILFENTEEIVLIRKGSRIMRCLMKDADKLDAVLTEFVSYVRPEIKEFHLAVEKFKEDIPEVIEALRAMIARQARTNKKFKKANAEFQELCKDSINTNVTENDIKEMLIQHILTAEIFDTVFGASHFHRENNIAKKLESVVSTFFTGQVRHNTLARIDSYYKVIKAEAARIDNHHEKQKFLKVIYENFYKAYNPKAADRLGIVYTPGEIVRFMIESTDRLLEKHFGKALADKNVEILDPATGTGTFITDIIEYIPNQYLEYKYKNEIHACELSILPYYIANLNIEFTYQQITGEYRPFENIVFVDTLDNLGFSYKGKQLSFGRYGLSAENLERIKRQNERKISVIIGNPPYNANQMNENDNNKNREYFHDKKKKRGGVDGRIKETYVKQSTAQKTKVYDMYSRFFRWASDRLNEDGIICFISNNSYLNSRTFDGFRKCIRKEFDYAYFVDLGGNIRELSGKDGIFLGEKHTVFGLAAMVGISISFLIKDSRSQNKNCQIKYIHPCDIRATRREKFEFLNDNPFKTIEFQSIKPDKYNNWLNITDNDFDELIPIADKKTKLAKSKVGEKAVFRLFASSIKTNRDEWVYDFEKNNLFQKIKYLIQTYNKQIESGKLKNNELDYSIKWSSGLKSKLSSKRSIKFKNSLLLNSLWRPFNRKFFYAEKILNDRLTSNHVEIWSKSLSNDNLIINISGLSAMKPFQVLSSKNSSDYEFIEKNQCLPLYRYESDGTRTDNITDWGLKQFTDHYPDKTVTKENIFHYTYAVLHNPAYRLKYEINLKREFPRLPFYKDFDKWVKWGLELTELHINYETVKPYPLKIHKTAEKENPKPKLRAIPEKGEIILDENTAVTGIPSRAWDYKLGNRSALHWILDQHKEKKPRDKTIAEKFNTYRFADYKKTVINLLKRVCRVSVITVEIMAKMAKEEPHK
ncbi:N-6 DNA methylase [Desulfococcaceae bacterium HSG7]|nr:N-6 DNA methylase [Desulfococcaceae bacterium HSG7]